MKYKGFDIVESDRHGKSCIGFKVLSSIQVREPFGPEGYLLRKQIRFPDGDLVRRDEAIEKAKAFVRSIVAKSSCRAA